MAGDHDFEACGLGLQVELRQIVQDVNGKAADLDNFSFRQFARPGVVVDVAADHGDGGDGCEGVENFGRADVSGVNDVLRALQSREGFGAKQAVSVGDDADEDGGLSSRSRFSVRGGRSDAVLLAFHFFYELADADQRPTDGAASYLRAPMPLAARCSMWMDVPTEISSPSRKAAARGRRQFPSDDHVRSGIDRRQPRMVRGECVIELDRLLGLGVSANGNVSSHSCDLCKRKEPMILSNHWLEPESKPVELRSTGQPRRLSLHGLANYATAIAVRRASIPSSAFHSMRAAFSAASRAASAASGWAAIRFSSCLRQTLE